MDIRPWRLESNHKDHLVIGGCDVVELAKTYGTPLHVVDEQSLRTNFRGFLKTFERPYPKVKVFYSYKTNCVPAVLKILHEEGCGAEVVSPYELWLALQLGVDASDIIYNGVNKSVEHLQTAMQEKVGLINADSVEEIQRLASVAENLKRPAKYGIRIYPSVGWRVQFGIQPHDKSLGPLLIHLRKRDLLNLCCLHAHIGTAIQNARYYSDIIGSACALMHKLRKELSITIESIDIGGGFGIGTVRHLTVWEIALYKLLNVPPRAPRAADVSSLEVFAETIAFSLKRWCNRYDLREPSLLLEPGRALTSNAQVLILTVQDIKVRRHGKTYAMTDGGMQNVAFPLSYEYHSCLLANKVHARPTRRYFVVGSLCSPEDVLYRNWRFPELRAGDMLAVMDAGAYFTSFANNFSYPRPAIVMVSEGSHRVIRERESFANMAALDRL